MGMDDYRGERLWHRDRPKPEHLAYLGPIGIEVVDANGTRSYDPNGAVHAFCIHDQHESLRPIDGLKSVCSGEPAVLYRTWEAEIALTPEEVYRLTMRALTPDEFTAICDAVGATWALHEDFYDPYTGIAEQPQVPVPGWEHLTEDAEDEERLSLA